MSRVGECYGQRTIFTVANPGAGNAFLGGLSAGILLSGGDIEQGGLVALGGRERVELITELTGMFYGSVSASFTVEQPGLPRIGNEGCKETWNGDQAHARLDALLQRHAAGKGA